MVMTGQCCRRGESGVKCVSDRVGSRWRWGEASVFGFEAGRSRGIWLGRGGEMDETQTGG